MSDNQTRLTISVLVISGFFSVVFGIFYFGIKPEIKDVILLLIGALIGSYKDVTNFFFSSSSGSVAKDKTISAIASAPIPAPIINNIPAPAVAQVIPMVNTPTGPAVATSEQ